MREMEWRGVMAERERESGTSDSSSTRMTATSPGCSVFYTPEKHEKCLLSHRLVELEVNQPGTRADQFFCVLPAITNSPKNCSLLHLGAFVVELQVPKQVATYVRMFKCCRQDRTNQVCRSRKDEDLIY